ncbi:phosphotransferase [Atopobium fossor]|uniref:phosphotransferase n=1 Tax=Atopobium fossor TaxID=39487 RepID=UPI00040915E4|nr:phosphotransferase [Atopobium fossor]
MAVTKNEFLVLRELKSTHEVVSQRKLSQLTGLSLGSVNAALKSCETAGYVADGLLTQVGIEALEPYKVNNAIIMAAGLSSRFAPISYERPKGLLRVRGEVLIERQIKQLKEAGISDITIVVGYKKEYFLYLRSKYKVNIVVNSEYAVRNNNSTLWLVRNKLSNTYICSSDDYFTQNPFEAYVYEAYYACVKAEGPTQEWCITTGANNRITQVTVGGADSLVMLGHVYFDKAFSERYRQILEAVYDKPETADKLWEEIYVDHINELDMIARPYEDGVINEFDSLDELRSFDQYFIENVDSEILDNIVEVLGCKKTDIYEFWPLKQGLTNLSCHFSVGEGNQKKQYVYRHPGVGTEKMISRASEAAGLRLARDLGLDSTFIHEDEESGWKLSRFIPNAQSLDTNDDKQLKHAMEMCRQLHDCDAKLERHFDFFEEGLSYEQLLLEHGPIEVPGYYELRDKIVRLKDFANADGYPECVSHNDFFSLNFLVEADGQMSLIDWEYAGMSDVANDFGTFTVCSEFTEQRANQALDYYFGRSATFEERRHFWSYVVLAGWCWYIWSLAKEAEGDNVGEWLFIYYRYAVDYIDKVLDWYENGQK